MADDILPFAGVDLVYKVHPQVISWQKRRELAKKQVLLHLSFYDGKGPRAAPDEPLNILLIHLAKIYKVDGSNTDPEDAIGMQRFILNEAVSVMGSWNGLVALYCHPGDFLLLNPTTGKENLVQVPIKQWMGFPSAEYMLYGICHDSGNDEYKAVIFASHNQFFHVVNFKRRSYKQKTQPELSGLEFYRGGHVGTTTVNGVPFWIWQASSSRYDKLYYFDPKTDEFRAGPSLPNQNAGGYGLGTLDGKLTVSFDCCQGAEFWSLETRGDVDSSYWSPLFVCTIKYGTLSPLSWMTRGVEVLIRMCENVLVIYNVREQTMMQLSKTVDKLLKGMRHQLVAYIPSSVDPAQ